MEAIMANRSIFPAMMRGLRGDCPCCGKGKIFYRYLKVSPRCASCDHELAQYPADDGPAYFTILIVGHLIVAPLLLFPWIWQESPYVVVPATLIPLTGLILLFLPRVKGAFIGLMYALGVKGADARFHTADAAD
jgi:uncharacterized protein (DUF983 family)